MLKRYALPLLAPAAVLAMLIFSVAPAGAETGYANLCPSLQTAFCAAATSEEEVGAATVDNSSGASAGDVWIIHHDRENDGNAEKLLKFDAAGNLLGEINEANLSGGARAISGGNNFFSQVTVDPTDGDVYASDSDSNVHTGTVTKFSSAGVFQFQLTGSETPQGSFYPFGVAVDPSNGDLYVSDSEHGEIDKFTSAGVYIEQFPVPLPSDGSGGLAIDAKGNLFLSVGRSALGPGENVMTEYNSTGAPVDCPDGSNVSLPEGGTGEVAVDPSDNHLFVGEGNGLEGGFIAEYSSFCAIEPSTKLGVSSGGFGVNASTHDVYAGISAQGESGAIFGQVTKPDVTTATLVTGITRTSAVVSGTVDPDETSVTTCEFEYGTTVNYGQSVPCAQTLPLSGNAPVTVTAEIKGLALPPATLMHFRLKAGNSNGADAGRDETFNLESLLPPVIGGLSTSGVTQFAATLNGTLETDEALVAYHFEYGMSTAYGQLAPVPDGFTPITTATVPVSEKIAGLQADTTYHYRLVASSPGKTGLDSPDETFTTAGIAAPLVNTGAAAGVGLGSATLSGTIDPQGWETTYSFQYGTSTAYGANWPTIPVALGGLSGAQPVSVFLENLQPSTLYHYRLVASNGGGTSYGPDQTFTTGEYPVSIVAQAPLLSGAAILFPTEAGTVPTVTPKSLTRAQKLAKALKACTKKPRKDRAGCEKQARKRYGPPAGKKKG
ncbi:MAG TPA: hypothetical protein VK730_02230 [Solirubrobacteraceae bacterium]|jgi:hypothetical protein|nr:hypothetical protein [Solirubrobacteraceae bacterium]